MKVDNQLHTETKEMKNEITAFMTEAKNSIEALQDNVKGLNDNQKTLESNKDLIQKDQKH